MVGTRFSSQVSKLKIGNIRVSFLTNKTLVARSKEEEDLTRGVLNVCAHVSTIIHMIIVIYSAKCIWYASKINYVRDSKNVSSFAFSQYGWDMMDMLCK